MRRIILLLLAQACCVLAYAQDLSLYAKKYFIRGNDTLPYRVLLPVNYDPAKKYPLILFLHGAGERGRNNESQLVHGGKLFLRDSIRNNYPAIVVFPQCPSTSYWSNVQIVRDPATQKRTFNFLAGGEPTVAMSLLLGLLRELEHQYRFKKDQLYVGGLSMGGMGTFELVRRKPKMFAAAFPICGGANIMTARKMARTAWWIFHGKKDDVVDPVFSMEMAAALEAHRADIQLTLYDNANHNSWDPAFAEPELMKWLFSKKK